MSRRDDQAKEVIRVLLDTCETLAAGWSVVDGRPPEIALARSGIAVAAAKDWLRGRSWEYVKEDILRADAMMAEVLEDPAARKAFGLRPKPL
jgi:hypothetical protein